MKQFVFFFTWNRRYCLLKMTSNDNITCSAYSNVSNSTKKFRYKCLFKIFTIVLKFSAIKYAHTFLWKSLITKSYYCTRLLLLNQAVTDDSQYNPKTIFQHHRFLHHTFPCIPTDTPQNARNTASPWRSFPSSTHTRLLLLKSVVTVTGLCARSPKTRFSIVRRIHSREE